jgi:hypothetical protein
MNDIIFLHYRHWWSLNDTILSYDWFRLVPWKIVSCALNDTTLLPDLYDFTSWIIPFYPMNDTFFPPERYYLVPWMTASWFTRISLLQWHHLAPGMILFCPVFLLEWYRIAPWKILSLNVDILTILYCLWFKHIMWSALHNSCTYCCLGKSAKYLSDKLNWSHVNICVIYYVFSKRDLIVPSSPNSGTQQN